MSSVRFWVAAPLTLLLFSPSTAAFAQGGKKAPRVAPPKFDKSQVEEYFLPDVFSKLVGERPNLQKLPQAATGGEGGGDEGGGVAPVKGWAEAISSEAIENEVKAVKLSLDKNITTPTAFRGNGYKECRREFSVAAMMFGIITEYDGDVRFTENASGLRDALARTGRNLKVSTPQAFQEAKQRRDDLQDTLGGATYQGKQGDPDLTWDQICDRSPLMQRLETASDKKVQPGTSSAAEFKKNKEMLAHEAQMIAAMAMVLTKEGMEDGDYDDYKEFCEQMKKGALDIVTAVKQDNYEAARTGAGIISKACSNCHDNYRG